MPVESTCLLIRNTEIDELLESSSDARQKGSFMYKT